MCLLFYYTRLLPGCASVCVRTCVHACVWGVVCARGVCVYVCVCVCVCVLVLCVDMCFPRRLVYPSCALSSVVVVAMMSFN